MQYSLIRILIFLAIVSAGCDKGASVSKEGKAEGAGTSMKADFNRGWTFVKSPAEWAVDFVEEGLEMEPVILPHTWNEDDMGPGLKEPYIGAGWYRKHFMAPRLRPGQRLLIEFEGVNNCHKVWVNGGYAGGRNGGFLASLHDITDLLVEGENTMFVRADNAYDLKAAMPLWIGWNRYGGITRPVWLHIRDHSYIACAGVEIRTPQVSVGSAGTVVRTHIEETKIGGATLEVRHTLSSPRGKVLSTTTRPLTTSYSLTNTIEVELPSVKKPELWSDVNPVLYTLHTEILEEARVIDSREDRIGYRFFHFDSEQGFTLNGIPTKLKGANIHVFFPGLGNALPERFHREDMKLMKEMGCNFMRSSHYPRPRATLEACDELGILVMEEQPYWHGSLRASGGEEAIHNASRLIRDLVRQHGNHPSIIAWNTVNEVMIAPAYKPGVGHLPPGHPGREAWRINPQEYPYLRRHLTKMVETFREVDPQRPVSMVVGGQWEKNDIAGLTLIADIVAYNGGAMNLPESKFTGPKTGKLYEFKPDYFREIYPDRIHMISEGVLNDYFFARGQWEMDQEGWRVNSRYWSIMNQRPWICGGSMWCFTDYSYEGNLDRHGVVDRYRLPKELFHFYKAMWADHPVLHILGHWNQRTALSREVVVFTNCREVELYLNGISLGKGVSCADEYPGIKNAPLVWKDVAYEEGTLEVRGTYDGQEMVDRRVTAGKAERLLLTASNDTLNADGRDISYVDLTICDAAGNRCYTSSCSLSVTVSGPARLAGPNEIKASAGLARVAVRSTGDPGKIKIEAMGNELRPGQISLTACVFFACSGTREYHVSTVGMDGNPGSESRPFRTISAAAQVAQPGDVIFVHEGVYRERINPPRGGTSEDMRIVYQAVEGEEVVIKGSERIKSWQKVAEGVWKLTLSNDFFGNYNPYKDLISGDWYFPGEREHHTGEVFLNEVSLFEVDVPEQVLNPIKDLDIKGSEYTWYCESDEEKTHIYANFQQYDPNEENVEISVRNTCFYPSETGINYITVRGFHLTQAATQWAPPTAEQIGLLGTNWSKGWIIENNSVSNSKCAGITLGKDSKSGNNVGDPADEGRVPDGVNLYNNVVDLVIKDGWNKTLIGSHIVRNNEIFDCGQAGICGSLGAIYSEISNNHIHDIWAKKQFKGFEMGGIKIHAAIDMLIKNNHIHNAYKGIWLDWMAQGTRISKNICYDNISQDLFLEVNHGPVLVDNNLFLSPFSIRSLSTGAAYVHNLVAGKTSFGSEERITPLFKPHTTQKISMREIPGGDDRFYNNIFAGEGLDKTKEAKLPVYADGNVEQEEFDPRLRLEREDGKLFLHITYTEDIFCLKNRLVDTELLGRTVIAKQLFETSKETPIIIDNDFFGKKRNTKNPVAGPFEINEAGEVKLQIR